MTGYKDSLFSSLETRLRGVAAGHADVIPYKDVSIEAPSSVVLQCSSGNSDQKPKEES